MSDHISSYRRRTLDVHAMLNLPTSPELWGVAGGQRHARHLAEAAGAEEATGGRGVLRTVAGWLAGLRRRAAERATGGTLAAAAR